VKLAVSYVHPERTKFPVKLANIARSFSSLDTLIRVIVELE
jgi:hypothetical protein